jgi:hypothetical protein
MTAAASVTLPGAHTGAISVLDGKDGEPPLTAKVHGG